MWAEVREGQLIGPKLVQKTTEKSSQIKDRLKVARDHQKSYADKRMKPLEFIVGDYVLLKVSPWKGVVRFGKKEKLAPRFVGPFEIIVKKCLADPTLQVPLDEIQVYAKLNFVEEPVKILEREFKKLKRSRIAIVKVRWNSKRGPEFTWELEDQMKLKYPHLFSDVTDVLPTNHCVVIIEAVGMLPRLVPHLVTPEIRMIERYVYGLASQIRGMVAATEPKTMQKAVHIFGAIRPIRLKREIWDCRGVPRNINPINARNPTVRACYECGSTDHVRSACPRLNRAQEPEGNHPNQVAANNGGQGRGNQGNQARGMAFMLRAEEARQDPNIVTGTFTLNNHFATTLFDSSVDYSFASTTFIPLLGLEPSDLGFRYEIEIASGQLVEIDKVIKGCKLEIKGHVFDIDLIPFGHGSFDVIIGIDWLSNYKAEIIFHGKVVRIQLPDGRVLRVLEERPEEKARLLMSDKANEKNQEEIVVVRDFPKVFPDDLSGLSPIREIEFRIELIPEQPP
ncbi:putative reverse transcriptase domain-containing protein [Tanacetum coccineum]